MKDMPKTDGKEKEDDGLIYLFGQVDIGDAERICGQIIRANTEGNIPHLQMIINSTGGSVHAGFAIIDMMEWSRIPIYTTALGLVASMGLMVFIAGEKGRRVITPRTSLLSHRYSSITFGNHSELLASRKEQDLLHCRIVNHYIQHTLVKSEEKLNQTLLRDLDVWLTPEQAMLYGVADLIQGDRRSPYPNIQTKDLEISLQKEVSVTC